MKTFKRALSVLLATVMILTTFFIFDPSDFFPTAKAAVTATDPTSYGDLYFNVPEAIYLQPRYNSSTATTNSKFQWFVNSRRKNNGTIELSTGESATGTIEFDYAEATNVRLSFEWQSAPGSVIYSNSKITFGDGDRGTEDVGFLLSENGGYSSTEIRGGTSPDMAADENGVWICWIATYKDSVDGQTKRAYAYTYVYKPYVAPIAVAIRSENTRGNNHYGSYISWISGVHGVKTFRGNWDGDDDGSGTNYYPKTNSNEHALLPFSNGDESGLECDQLYLSMGNRFYQHPNDDNPDTFISSSQTGVADKSVYHLKGTTNSHSSGSDMTVNFAYSSTGMLTVDSSRYTNLNQIPNLSVGMLVTDDEATDPAVGDVVKQGAWFMTNFTGHNSTFEKDYSDYWDTSKGEQYRARYWDPLFAGSPIRNAGNWNDMHGGDQSEGVKINERWSRAIPGSSQVYYVGAGYANAAHWRLKVFGWTAMQDDYDYIYDLAELRCHIEVIDKSALRNAYRYAIKAAASVNDTLFDTDSNQWKEFEGLFNAVAKWLCKVDCGAYTATTVRNTTYSSAAALASALISKTDDLKLMSASGRLKHNALQRNVVVYADPDNNNLWTYVSHSDATANNYHKGAKVVFTPANIPGYTCMGFAEGFSEPQGTPGAPTYKQAADVHLGDDVVYAQGGLTRSYYYLRDTYTITYDLAGGTMAAGVTNPTTYTVETPTFTLNNPTKRGYTFSGWDGGDGVEPQTTLTIAKGSTGNRTYTATWGPKQYTIHYDGNGATYGEMTDSNPAYGVPEALHANEYGRGYDMTYHFGYNDEFGNEIIEVDDINWSYVFQCWNTDPNGDGETYLDKQVVTSVGDDDYVTLYAQWTPSHKMRLPSPQRTGYGFAGWYTDPGLTHLAGLGGAEYLPTDDTELYAKWLENTYNIRYEGNGSTAGSTPTSMHRPDVPQALTKNGFERKYIVTFETNGGTLGEYSKTSTYDFLYWNTEEDGSGSRNFVDEEMILNINDLLSIAPNGTLVLYAQWSNDNAAVALDTPIRGGYAFEGWYTTPNCAAGTKVVGSTFLPTANTKLYANWTLQDFEITFNANGGEAVSPSTMTYNVENTTSQMLPTTTRFGYTLAGWKPVKDDPNDDIGNWDPTGLYTAGSSVKDMYGDVTLYAQWTPVSYTITFDTDGGNAYPNYEGKKTYNIASTDMLGTPTKNGYTFTNWTVKTSGGNWGDIGTSYDDDFVLTNMYGDVELLAHWTVASYELSFDSNGGASVANMPYNTESTDTLPLPEYNGYEFRGWKPEMTLGSWDVNTIYNDGTPLTGKWGSARLIAQWREKQYYINFSENGGEEVDNILYNINTLGVVLPATTRTGYTFGGWKPKDTSGNWDKDTIYPALTTSVTGKYGDVTLVAQWTANEYTITFDTNSRPEEEVYYPPHEVDPLHTNTMTYTINSMEDIGAPTRAGYQFEGWKLTAKDSDCVYWEVNKVYPATTHLQSRYGNVSLQAQWELEMYNLVYDYRGGAVAEANPTSYTVETPTFALNNPTKPGYDFAGWTENDGDTPNVNVEIRTGSTGDHLFVANWSDPVVYTITYELAGGSLAEGVTNPTTYTIETDDFSLNNPAKTGYNFAGWTGTGIPQDEAWVNVPILKGSYGNRSYVATWTPKEYTIRYTLNGATSTPENPETYTIETETFTLINPLKDGYTFAGWTGDNGTTPQTTVSVATGTIGNLAFTANWTANEYTITYDLAGGELSQGVTNPATYTTDTESFTLQNPSRDGYTFAGWTGSNGENPQTTVLISKGSMGDKTYTAVWTHNDYTITYNLAGGSLPDGEENPTSYSFNSEDITLVNPIRPGYTFDGWTGTGLTEPTMTVTIVSGSTGDRTYDANWTLVTFTITYDLAGGTVATANPTSYTVETPTFSLINPTRDGYTFAGWTGTDITLGEAWVNVQITMGSSGDRSYTATWTPVSYSITYLANRPAGVTKEVVFDPLNPSSYTIETPTFSLRAPSLEGYTFEGWTLEAVGTGANVTPDPANATPIPNKEVLVGTMGELTFKAHWSNAQSYNIYYYDGEYTADGSTLMTDTGNPAQYTVNSVFTLINPVRPGYAFVGWTEFGGSAAPSTSFMIVNRTGDLYLIANWEANSYIVKFEGGADTTGFMADMACTYGVTYELPENLFRKTGYTFAGWALTTGGAVVYADKAQVSNLTSSDEIYLFAVWGVDSYTISFDGNGNTNEGAVVPSITAEYLTKVTLPTGKLADGSDDPNFFICYSTTPTQEQSRTFLGWSDAEDNLYKPGAQYTCRKDETLSAVWSANYYFLDELIERIEDYRKYDSVPANNNDPQYKLGGVYATQFGSGGNYPWNNYDMTDVEDALTEAMKESNRNLPQISQPVVNGMQTTLQNALNAITLLPVDPDKQISCSYSGAGFRDSYTGIVYPPCETGRKHSYNSLKGVIDEIFLQDDDDCLYTAASVQALHDYIYGNGLDVTGVVTQVTNAALKKPAQGILDSYVRGMAQNYHRTLVLKGADYTDLDALITQYLPSLHNDVEAGQNVTYSNLESYYTEESVDDLRAYYDDISREYKNVQQWLLEPEGDVYEGLKDSIDALEPLEANYTNVFYKILTIPTGTPGFSYPDTAATLDTYPTWIEWAFDNAGDISSQMDTDYLEAYYTDESLTALYNVLDNIDWERNVFQQADVDGADNFTSYYTLLDNTIRALVAREYTIVFMFNDGVHGTYTTQGNYHYGDRIGSFPNEPVRENYVFRGWSLTSNGSEALTTDYNVLDNISLYAIWISEYRITYNNSVPGVALTWEAGVTVPQTYSSADNDITIPNPIREGYDFAGWEGTGLTGPTMTVVIPAGSTGNRSYTASWIPHLYTITYYDEDGTTVLTGLTPSTYTIETADFVLPTPEKDGHTFVGWTGKGIPMPQPLVVIEEGTTGDKVYAAHWTTAAYTITYDLDGGSMPDDVTNPTGYSFTDADITLNNPEKAGYTFTGWTGTDLTGKVMTVVIPSGSTGDRAYTATWRTVTYTITYDLAGGELAEEDENEEYYTIKTASFTLNNPTREYYEFAGWTGTDLAEPTLEVTIAKGSSGDREYTATWTPIEFALTYDLDGGAMPDGVTNPASYSIETESFTLNAPEREGYLFTGWTGTDLSGETTEVTIAKGSTGERSFTAHWVTSTFTINYDLADGELPDGVTNPTSYLTTTETFTLNNPTKLGYDFAGWTGTGLSEATTTVTIATGSTGNRSYTATWSAHEYTITYDLDDGSLQFENPATYTIEDYAITLNNPTKSGYDFAGWTGTDLTEATKDVTIESGSTGDRSYKANYIAKVYTITYYDSDNTLLPDIGNPATYTVETETFTLINPEKLGYTFTGWTGSNSATTPNTTVTIEKGSTSNKIYKANWTATQYSISYDLAGGSITVGNPASYNINSSSFTLSIPTRRGYNFGGWTGTDLTEPTKEVTIESGSTGDRSYTATWNAIEYTITYELGGGTSDNPTTYTVETPDITLQDPVRPGYAFTGWTGDNGDDPEMVVVIPQGTIRDKSYTAHWALQTFTITYLDSDGETELPDIGNPATYTAEYAAFTLNNPTKDGYDFAGWTGTDLTEATMTVTIETGSSGNRTYTATWTAQEYTIDYDLDGGAVAQANPTTYTVESETFTLTNPTRAGYTFAGWTGTDLAGAATEVTIAKGSTGDRTYTATWSIINYTISYDLDGGDAENPETYTIETETFTLQNPTRAGYDFAGWTGTDLIVATTPVAIAKGTTGDRSYTATWNVKTYSITYELAGGTLAEENPTSYTVNSEAITLHNPTRTGFTFAGWTGTGLDAATTEVTIAKGSTGDRAYTATWAADAFTITYDLAGGDAENPTTYTVETETFALNNPTRAGYEFTGWTGTDLSEASMTVTITKGSRGDRSYTATWAIVDYTIGYDLAGGTVADENPTSYNINSEAITLNNPTRTGYTFTGWTGTDLSGASTEVTIAAGSTGNRSYTAVWNAIVYSITYDLADGALAEGKTNPTTYTIETAAFVLNNPSKTGYTFTGWTGTDLTEPTLSVMIAGNTGDRTYTANYAVNGYTINYDLDGGAVATANPTYYTVDTETFTLNNPIRAGYTFTGWTGTDLAEATTTVTIAKGSTGDRSYTATWSLDTYTISYELAGGALNEGESNPTSYNVNSDAIRLNNPTRRGYDFAGWTGTDLEEATVRVTIAKGSTGDRSYTATWDLKEYTITYDLAGGDDFGQNPTTYTVESPEIVLNEPERDGYTFEGWDGTDLDETTVDVVIEAGSIGDRSYTAVWTADTFTISYDLAGGALEEGKENPTTYTVEDEFKLNNPILAGYTFMGWTGTDLAEATTEVTITKGSIGIRRYTATWAVTDYTINYDLAGGTVADENPTSYTVNSEAITLNNPTRTGYTFAGWTGTDLAEATTTVTIAKGSTGNRSYTANWTAVEYKITYDLAGGEVADANPTTYTIETAAFNLNNPTRTGYTFAGWTGTDLTAPQTTVMIAHGSTGDRSYTATWTADGFTISYDLAGGAVAIENPTTYTADTETFTLNNPIKAGYTFTGWTGTGLDEATMTVTIETGSMGNRSYTANWTVVEYTIGYELAGGALAEENPTTFTVETATFTLKVPTKTGYTFDGWTGSNGDEAETVVVIEKGSIGDKNFTANWTAIEYTISYELAGGTLNEGETNPTVYTIESSTFTLYNPAKTGYTFTGWTGTGLDEATMTVTIETGSMGARSYTATWTEADFTLSFDGNGATSGSVADMGATYGQTVKLPSGDALKLYSDENRESRTFRGWDLDGTFYEAGADFECPSHDVTFTAVWSANYYELDALVALIEDYRTNDAVPANDNDPNYKQGSDFATQSGTDGKYPWNNYDMTDVEAALTQATADENHGLPQDRQPIVNGMTTTLQNALDAITLLPVDPDKLISCSYSGAGFHDSYSGNVYPPCESGKKHSYNSLLAVMDAIFAQSDDECLYTAASVQALHDVIYGNGLDVTGITTQVANAALKRPAQGTLDSYVRSMAQAYHRTLVLKGADYTNLDKLITEYLPGLHNDVEAGQGVTYSNLESYYTVESVAELREHYSAISREYKNVQQPLLEEGGDVYEGLKDMIDALVPLEANYTNVFYKILTIPTGTPGFSYPASEATLETYPTWLAWAQENAGDISSQMDTAYLEAYYTESSVTALYDVLNDIDWERNLFEQNDVDGTNTTSYLTLLDNTIRGLTPREYVITYMYNDGTSATFTTQGNYRYGDRIGSFPQTEPERTDYVFKGWASEPDGTVPVTVDDRILADMNLYAIWGLAADEKVELIAREGSTTVIDPSNNFIYGLKVGITKDELLNEYLDVIGNGRLEVTNSKIGTGVQVKLINNYTDEVVDTYTLIIFGDANGDGLINSSDVTKVRNMSARLEDNKITNPYAFAANVSVDSIVNSTDVTVLRSLAAKLLEIDQVTRETYDA